MKHNVGRKGVNLVRKGSKLVPTACGPQEQAEPRGTRAKKTPLPEGAAAGGAQAKKKKTASDDAKKKK